MGRVWAHTGAIGCIVLSRAGYMAIIVTKLKLLASPL